MVKGTHVYLALIALGLLSVIFIQWTKIGELKLQNKEFDIKVDQLESKRTEIQKKVDVYQSTLDSLKSENDSLKSIYHEIPSDDETTPTVVIDGSNSWGQITGVLEVNGDTIH